MRRLNFNISKNEDFYEYHLSATYNKWLEKTIFTDRVKFYDSLFKYQKNQFDKLFYNFAYNNCTHEENIFIYERLIWNLIKDKNIFVIINYNLSSFLKNNNLPFDKICWEYEIENRVSIEWTETIFTDRDFIAARNVEWDDEDKNKTAIFEINSFEMFLKIIYVCSKDDCSLLNFFWIDKKIKKDTIIKILQWNKRPKLLDLLENNDLFIALFLGCDDGYQDYILIKSKNEITDSINKLTDNINTAWEKYENKLDSVETFQEYTDLIDVCFWLNIIK